VKKPAPRGGYTKISATLEAPVLAQIREKTDNVSGFLNDAAKRKLYFDMLRATDEELRREGVEVDERFYRNLKKWIHEVDARQAGRGRRAERRARTG
jgi:hypothetical protein